MVRQQGLLVLELGLCLLGSLIEGVSVPACIHV
jgi:hypothetical protein